MEDKRLLENAIHSIKEKKAYIEFLKKEINKEALSVKESLLDTALIEVSVNSRQLYFVLTVFSESKKDNVTCDSLVLSLVVTINQDNSIESDIMSRLNILRHKEALNLLDDIEARKKLAIGKREISSLKNEKLSDFIIRVGLDVENNLEKDFIKEKQDLVKLQKDKSLVNNFKNVFKDKLYDFECVVSIKDRDKTAKELQAMITSKETVKGIIDSLVEKRTKGEMLKLDRELKTQSLEKVSGGRLKL